MKEIKVAILDDEKDSICNIKYIVEKVFGRIEHKIYEYSSSAELLDSGASCDILLIDMELKETGDLDEGINVVKKYQEKGENPIVIFVTSHNEFARDGYKVSAFRYVWKNELKNELYEALLDAYDVLQDMETIILSIMDAKGKKIECKREIVVSEIEYFETELRKVRIHLRNESMLVNVPINDLFEMINDSRFYFVQRSYVVNMRYVAGMNKKEIVLYSGEKIPIGRTKKEEIEEVFWQEKRMRRL
ncbi:MAG: response regulator transcription factor [Lachnospiraceae bacterium]|nr:response regulator transcription factor [Lachnospiraceae bacterium]